MKKRYAILHKVYCGLDPRNMVSKATIRELRHNLFVFIDIIEYFLNYGHIFKTLIS